MPLLSCWHGYTPNKMKRMGDHLPHRVAQKWALTCWRRQLLLSKLQPEENFYHSITCPMLMLSFADDLIAPKKGVDALRHIYYNARVTRRHLQCRELGVKKIGHVGFFQKSFQNHWSIFTEWMEEIT